MRDTGVRDGVRAVGLMSGTSADGIDGVLLDLPAESAESDGGVAILATVHQPFPATVRDAINRLIETPSAGIDRLGELHTQLGVLYAGTAAQLQAKSDAPVAVIGCHGQTVRHRPGGEFPFTLQLGNGAVIAQRTGVATVTDFRAADIAASGQGAPLAPAFHHAVFAGRSESRAILNLGGIANLTHLPAGVAGDFDSVAGFDTGPGNTLLDAWHQRHFAGRFDHNGDTAAAGRVHDDLLAALLAEPYFAQPTPKSTGRELFNAGWLARIMDKGGFADPDPKNVQATLTALTAESVAMHVRRLSPAVDAVYACGGGVHNRALMRMLAERCGDGCRVTTTAELGIAAQWVEAAAFAWLAARTVHRQPATLPSVTGATKPSIAGAVYFPAS